MVDDDSHPQRSPEGPVSFGKYLLDAEIARGGMARVYLARLRGLGGFEKRLVVKQILPHLAEDPRFVEMFVDEAKTLVALSHPHVVPVYELGVEGGVYFLAMEHVEGATLTDMLAQGPLGAAEVAHVGVQVADALAYAEEKFGLVHRDVTPRNVMVEASGHARLLDFGIAARADDVAPEAGGRGLYGTPGYLSPEQARGERLGGQSDLFSLACVLYEALHARPLFSPRDVDAVRSLTAAQVAELVPEEGELSRAIRACLQPDPELRPESARALGKMLRAVSATGEDPARVLGERADEARRRVNAAQASARARDAEVLREGGTPVSGPEAPSATLATSELLGAMLGTPPGGGTAKIDRGSAVTVPRLEAEHASGASGPATAPISPAPSAESGPSTTRIVPAEPTAPPRSLGPGWSVGAALVLGTLAAILAARAELDPRTPDATLVETDTDGTMFIPPEDAGIDDAAIDAATDDAGLEDVSDGGVPGDATSEPSDGRDRDAGRSRPATLRVTSDGSLTVRLDGRPIGHAPIASQSVPAGEHRLTFECDFLGRAAEERVRFTAGVAVRIRVTCNTNPPRVVIAAP